MISRLTPFNQLTGNKENEKHSDDEFHFSYESTRCVTSYGMGYLVKGIKIRYSHLFVVSRFSSKFQSLLTSKLNVKIIASVSYEIDQGNQFAHFLFSICSDHFGGILFVLVVRFVAFNGNG